MFLGMRNTHLILGLVFLVMVVIFAVSSLTIIYRPWLPTSKEDHERTIAIAAEQATTPRALALELMRNHGLKGDLLQIRQTDDEIRFRIARPGMHAQVQYSSATGEAKITKGYELPAKWVIHTVGPVWHGGTADEDRLLRNCYRNALELAKQNGVRTIAFPSISTGAYRFPLERAARIAVDTVKEFFASNESFDQVVFCCFDADAAQTYRSILGGPP